MTEILAKNLGKVAKRALVEVLYMKNDRALVSNYSLSFSVDSHYGLGISVLCPYFLFELNFLPLVSKTYSSR